MFWPSPMGRGPSSYARLRNSAGTNSCRGTFFMAASTEASLMPLRWICVSTMERRAASYCADVKSVPESTASLNGLSRLLTKVITSHGRRGGDGMSFPCVGAEDGVDLFDH